MREHGAHGTPIDVQQGCEACSPFSWQKNAKETMMLKRHPRWCVVLVAFSALTAFIRQPSRLAADDPKPGAVVFQCRGYIVLARQVTVVPKVAGQVVELMIDEGK